MAEQIVPASATAAEKEKRGLSLDGWAVVVALALVAMVRLGVLKHVVW
jgi:hypothetical protein